MIEPWEDLARQLRLALDDELPVEAVLEAEEAIDVGATSFDVVIESSGAALDDQVENYGSLYDLLSTRLQQGKDQVLGCLIIDGEPEASAFARGLDGMARDSGDFTPVIPLARQRAQSLVAADGSLFELVDKATALIGIAADRNPITEDVAATALSEIDELVERSLVASAES